MADSQLFLGARGVTVRLSGNRARKRTSQHPDVPPLTATSSHFPTSQTAWSWCPGYWWRLFGPSPRVWCGAGQFASSGSPPAIGRNPWSSRCHGAVVGPKTPPQSPARKLWRLLHNWTQMPVTITNSAYGVSQISVKYSPYVRRRKIGNGIFRWLMDSEKGRGITVRNLQDKTALIVKSKLDPFQI